MHLSVSLFVSKHLLNLHNINKKLYIFFLSNLRNKNKYLTYSTFFFIKNEVSLLKINYEKEKYIVYFAKAFLKYFKCCTTKTNIGQKWFQLIGSF
jgi:hypothetical protein